MADKKLEIDLPEFLEADKAIKAKILKRSREAAVQAVQGYARMQAKRWLKINEDVVQEAVRKAMEKYLTENLQELADRAVKDYGLFLADAENTRR